MYKLECSKLILPEGYIFKGNWIERMYTTAEIYADKDIMFKLGIKEVCVVEDRSFFDNMEWSKGRS